MLKLQDHLLGKMTDTDSDCEFVRTNSFDGHETVPRDETYKIKFKSCDGKSTAVLYTLKKGQELPYYPTLEGFKLKFGKDLKPSMGVNWKCEKKKDIWIFKGCILTLILLITLLWGLEETGLVEQHLSDEVSECALATPPMSKSYDLFESPTATSTPALVPRSLVGDFEQQHLVRKSIADMHSASTKSEDEMIMELFVTTDDG